MKVAIVGSGIAGMGAAHFLHQKSDITVYEQNNHIGGHTHTVTVDEDGRYIPVDTGFIVFNYNTYPNLCRLFKELNVEVQKTDMSFGVQYKPTGLEYCGSSLNQLFAQRKNIFNPGYIRFLLQLNRFNEQCIEVLEKPEYEHFSVADYVKEKKYGNDFLYKYLLPMTSALWSAPTDITLSFPIVVLVRFFKNHGFLGLSTQFQWHTVSGGSWQYRDKLIAPFKDKIKTGNPVASITRNNEKSLVTTSDGVSETYDKVILACHADQALHLLGDATDTERKLLSPFKYHKNVATLHTDASVMPQSKLCWSAWNYRIDQIGGNLVPHCIYNMNILQQVSDKYQYMVSINDPGLVDEKKIIRKIEYEHPIFTTETMMAQKDLHQLNENGVTYFCGSYFKYGFHEDAFTSSLEMCRKLTGEPIWQ